VRRALAVALGAGLVAGCGGGAAAERRDGGAAHRGGVSTAISVLAQRRLDARLTEWTLRSTALDRPTRVRILLPAGYAVKPRRRYPVLYLLHGRNGGERDWTRYGDAERATARSDLIVVMPDAGRAAAYTDWYRAGAPVRPRWEAYHVGQLVRWVDARFRTIAARAGRAVAGLSMGGFGALSYAARNPSVFAAAASFSGALELGSTDAWGPRATNGARWRAHLPIALASRLRSLDLLVVRTGNGRPGPLDRPGTRAGCPACVIERFLRPMNVRLHRRLRALRIRHVWDGYGPGTHDWPYWRRDLRETLPALTRALARPR
jgi:diacylglycerol O-acyltransferase / trehalose O-mycolyltransferase